MLLLLYSICLNIFCEVKMSGIPSYIELTSEINQHLAPFRKESPEVMKAFGELARAATKTNVLDEKTKELIIKIVNADSQPKAVILNTKNLRLGGKMIKIILSADTLDTENSFTSEPIQPKENSESIKRGKISTEIPSKSVVILKINKL